MSIQPNRVLARIIEQVERSDWPPLDFELRSSNDGNEWMRIFCEPAQDRYATPFHFWVHALRDDLAARSRGEDLMDIAGYALCQKHSFEDWRAEVGEAWPGVDSAPAKHAIYRMQANACRKSSVAWIGDRLMAHFWQHGFAETWRRRGMR